jgi:hypothetical protein
MASMSMERFMRGSFVQVWPLCNHFFSPTASQSQLGQSKQNKIRMPSVKDLRVKVRLQILPFTACWSPYCGIGLWIVEKHARICFLLVTFLNHSTLFQMKAARAAYKADKADKALKKAYKKAKAALDEAKAAKKIAEAKGGDLGGAEPSGGEAGGHFLDAPTKKPATKRTAEQTGAGGVDAGDQNKKKRQKSVQTEDTTAMETASGSADTTSAEPTRPPLCKVFVSNLSFDVTEADVRSLFEPCGNVTEV